MKTLANRLLDLHAWQFIVLLVGGDVALGAVMWMASGSLHLAFMTATVYNLALTVIVGQWR